MPRSSNRQILLANRPVGMPKASDFLLNETSIPTPVGGQVLCETLYLSLDPYMRGRMSPSKSYAKPVEINEVMTGGTVGKVIESRDPNLKVGDYLFVSKYSYGFSKHSLPFSLPLIPGRIFSK